MPDSKPLQVTPPPGLSFPYTCLRLPGVQVRAVLRLDFSSRWIHPSRAQRP